MSFMLFYFIKRETIMVSNSLHYLLVDRTLSFSITCIKRKQWGRTACKERTSLF